jgi:cyanophycin synthetase
MEDLRLLRVNHLRGPNIWTYRPALEVWLDLGRLEERPSNTIPGFNERLVSHLPGLAEHHCGVGERGGFLQRLESGTYAGHILEHVVIELLNLAGMPTAFGQTRSTSKTGVYRMVFRARDERVARTALAEGHRLLNAVLRGESFEVASAVDTVRGEIARSYLDSTTASIVAAATDRGIPHIRLDKGNLVQFGYGARQRRIWESQTGQTSAIAQEISRDEALSRAQLAPCGVPVPESRVVHSADDAWEAAQSLGLPVIMKPSESGRTRGTLVDLAGEDAVRAAFASFADDAPAIVERQIPGAMHRLLVVGGKLIAAVKGTGTSVTGDGRSTVQELVDAQLNTGAAPRILCAFDPEIVRALKRQGLSADAAPTAGRVVLVQSIGRDAVDCTDEVHPEVARVVALAARVVGIDLAGVDVAAQDIARPLAEQSGAVIAVHAAPALRMHLELAHGEPRPVGRAIVDHLYPEAEDGRIPVIGVAGSRCTGRIVRLIAWIMHLGGRYVGVASRVGLCFDRRRVDRGDGTRWDSARRLLAHHAVEAAVFETDAAAILRDGLPYDRCEIGVVHDIDGHEALGEFDVSEASQMFKVMRTQVDAVLARGAAVLHAVDERIVDMAELSDGAVVLYARDGANAAIAAHRAAGGRAVFARGKSIVLAAGDDESTLPDLLHGDVPHAKTDEATLAGVAAMWMHGIDPDVIVTGVATFGSDLDPYSQMLHDDGAAPGDGRMR